MSLAVENLEHSMAQLTIKPFRMSVLSEPRSGEL